MTRLSPIYYTQIRNSALNKRSVFCSLLAKANQLANFPLNFLRTGRYNHDEGKVGYRTTYGYQWLANRNSATSSNYLVTGTSVIYPQYDTDRGYGLALRCVLSSALFLKSAHSDDIIYPCYFVFWSVRKTKKRALSLPTTNTNDVPAKANQLANFPLNFLRTGYYRYSDGGLNYLTAYGFWWGSTQFSARDVADLHGSVDSVYPRNNNERGFGFARR